VIEFKARVPQQNQRGNRQRGYAHACGEVFSGSGNSHKPHLPRRKPEGGKHLAARSDQTAEREREVSSAQSTTLQMALVKGSGEVRSEPPDPERTTCSFALCQDIPCIATKILRPEQCRRPAIEKETAN